MCWRSNYTLLRGYLPLQGGIRTHVRSINARGKGGVYLPRGGGLLVPWGGVLVPGGGLSPFGRSSPPSEGDLHPMGGYLLPWVGNYAL